MSQTEGIHAGVQRWEDKAACKEMNTDIFFEYDKTTERFARAICNKCEVREECLQFAIKYRIGHGIYGGMNPDERRDIHNIYRKRSKRGQETEANTQKERMIV